MKEKRPRVKTSKIIFSTERTRQGIRTVISKTTQKLWEHKLN